MDDLLGEFLAETREMLAALSGELVAWEADPADRERLDKIFRFFHTVKGNCGFFDLPRLEALSHAAEDALGDVRNGRRSADTRLVDLILAVIDRIEAMVVEIEAAGEVTHEGDEGLIAALAAADDETALPRARLNSGTPTMSHSVKNRTVRLPVELIDQVMSGVSEMVLIRNDLARRLDAVSGNSGLDAPFGRLSALLNEVRDAITRARMRGIDGLFATFPRLVRDLSADLGKQVLIDLESGEVELDREVIELIRDPLVHIIRNAIDHGIEAPTERRAAGKHECGVLTIAARQTGDTIHIGIMDDGRGIDDQQLVGKAVAMGLVSASDAEAMTREERLALVCEPGLSTAEEITEISGRGVGMDVVRANIEKFGGTLKVESTPGAGSRFLIAVPLTLSILPSLTLRSAGQTFAIPRSYVEEIVSPLAGGLEFTQVGESRYLTFRGRRLPCISLADALALPDPDLSRQRSNLVYAILRLGWGDLYALEVDAVLDHQELVIKPLSPLAMRSGMFVGCTQLNDGAPVLVLDVTALGYASGISRDLQRPSVPDQVRSAEQDERSIEVMVLRDLAGNRQAIPLTAVAKVERLSAPSVRLAGTNSTIRIGDDILSLAGVQEGVSLPDPLVVLQIADGADRVAYAVHEVMDLGVIVGPIQPVSGSRALAGVALVDGEMTEILDGGALVAARALAA